MIHVLIRSLQKKITASAAVAACFPSPLIHFTICCPHTAIVGATLCLHWLSFLPADRQWFIYHEPLHCRADEEWRDLDEIIFSDLLNETAKGTERRLRTTDPAHTSAGDGSVAAESCVEVCKSSENIFTALIFTDAVLPTVQVHVQNYFCSWECSWKRLQPPLRWPSFHICSCCLAWKHHWGDLCRQGCRQVLLSLRHNIRVYRMIFRSTAWTAAK